MPNLKTKDRMFKWISKYGFCMTYHLDELKLIQELVDEGKVVWGDSLKGFENSMNSSYTGVLNDERGTRLLAKMYKESTR